MPGRAGGRRARGLAFASGLAAEDTLLRTICRPGDHVVIPNDAYGGTFRLFARVLQPLGARATPPVAGLGPRRGPRRAASRPTRLVWCETPTNPLLGIADIAALAEIAHDAGALLVVDNTFASPYLQQPLALGADVVVHSTTKYLGGHSDVVGGAWSTADASSARSSPSTRTRWARSPGRSTPGWCCAASRRWACGWTGTATTPSGSSSCWPAHRAVSQVLYPGLPDHPGHEVAAKQMRRFGGMVSFRLAAARRPRWRSATATQLFTLAESLGGVESLIEHPAG